MNLNALGYVGIRAKNLEDWVTYGTRFLGMQMVDKSRGTLALRMDDRKQRVIAVSYTHLDVYKRQGHGGGDEAKYADGAVTAEKERDDEAREDRGKPAP